MTGIYESERILVTSMPFHAPDVALSLMCDEMESMRSMLVAPHIAEKLILFCSYGTDPRFCKGEGVTLNYTQAKVVWTKWSTRRAVEWVIGNYDYVLRKSHPELTVAQRSDMRYRKAVLTSVAREALHNVGVRARADDDVHARRNRGRGKKPVATAVVCRPHGERLREHLVESGTARPRACQNLRERRVRIARCKCRCRRRR